MAAEHSPPTNVGRVQENPGVDAMCELSFSVVRSFTSRGFFPVLKNQHFQIPTRSRTHGHIKTFPEELLKFLVGKQISIVFFFSTLPRKLSRNKIQLSPEGEVNSGRFIPKT